VPPGLGDLSIPRVHRHCQTVAEECAGVIFVAVDIGGTFTDLIGFDDQAGRFIQAKSLTTPPNLVQGIID
jgi:Hydantoinase/oxoprolinase N-terminal region